MKTVLDASAVLAWLLSEPGGVQVERLLKDASVSTINLAEVITRLLDRGTPPGQSRPLLLRAPMTVHVFDAEDAVASAELRPATRHRGLSLGDRACLALARRLGLPALTTDRAWGGLEVGVEIRLLR